jgi:hypothetical protein
MRVAIRALRPGPDLQKRLQKDGWKLQTFQDGLLIAQHPEALDEPLARLRLHRLGLLTSARLSIRFERLRQTISTIC